MTGLVLRVLTPNDAEMLYEHYRDLDAASKGCRFGIQISDVALRQFLSQLDLRRDIHFAVVQEHRILALAQISQYTSAHRDRLELGISVATDARRQGYASLLWDYATAHARACNMHEIYVLHSPRNTAMATFCRQKGLRIEDDLGERVGIWTNPQWSEEHGQESVVTLPMQEWPGILPWPSALPADGPTRLMAGA